MIYATQARATQVANALNLRYGHAKACAVLTRQGWTVVTSYEFGMTNPQLEPQRTL